MAKINWNRSRQQALISKKQAENIQKNKSRQDFWVFLKKGLWPIKGKHKGKEISSLDEGYLRWVQTNLKGVPADLATKELDRRALDRSNST